MKLFLKAEPATAFAPVRVREFFEMGVPGGPDPDSKPNVLTGYIDEGIKKEHAKEYAAFEAYVNSHQEELYEAARAQVGVPLEVPYLEKAEVVEAEAVKPKAKKGVKK